jgi:hypothetical protein
VLTDIAAERRKICSPRREPWVIEMTDTSAAERRNNEDPNDVSPLRGYVFVYRNPMAYAMGYRSIAAPRLVWSGEQWFYRQGV